MSAEMERAERLWAEVERVLKPAVMEISVRRDSGPVLVEFNSGEYQRAKATRNL